MTRSNPLFLRPGADALATLPASMRERDRRITAALAEARALVRAARREARA